MHRTVFSFAYTPLQALYPVECLQTNSRAKGMSMYGIIVGAISFINTYCTPIALQNIRYNYIFIFVGWDCLESFIWSAVPRRLRRFSPDDILPSFRYLVAVETLVWN